jgi:hypothetical protein
MTAAVIHTWQPNLLAQSPHKQEIESICRKMFTPMIVCQLYTAPECCFYEHDEGGQWADDGGRVPE